MNKKRRVDRPNPSISIGGNVGGSVIVGDKNVAVNSVAKGATVMVSGRDISQVFTNDQRSILRQIGTEDEIMTLESSFQRLKEEISQEAPQQLQSAAFEQADTLQKQVTNQKPDMTALEKVKTWFLDNLPGLLGTLTAILTHPIVGKLVEATGEFTLSQFRKHLGLPDKS